jgi:hypothetical protein
MFSLGVLETDAFLDMPLSAQALYFHLNLRADDDGFVGNPKRLTQSLGANLDDLKLLVAKRFLIAFDDGVIVIKHWRMHNAIKRDRYTQTNFTEDLMMLDIKDNGAYTLRDGALLENKWSTDGAQMAQTCSADKIRIDKVSKDKDRHKYGVDANVLLTDEEYEKLKNLYPDDYEQRIDDLSLYLSSKGKTYKNHFATIRNWDRMDKKREAAAPHRPTPEEEQKRAWEAFLERHKDEPDGEHYD